MDLWHLKNSELGPQCQKKYKGRVVLRGDTVKDDSGSCAMFTEQGSPASQMTAAKVMDIISKLPSCAGQAAYVLSAFSQEDASARWKIPKSECPDIWIRPPEHKFPKSLSSMEDPVVLVERNLYGHPLARLLWETQFEKVLLEHGWVKLLGMFLFQPSKRIILIRVCGRYQTGRKDRKHRIDLENSWKTLIWENQHHFLTMKIWVALKENVKSARILWRTA